MPRGRPKKVIAAPVDPDAPKKKGGRPKGSSKRTVKQVEAALRANGGIRLLAAEALGVDRRRIDYAVRDFPYLRDVIAEVTAANIDVAEAVIMNAIRKGDTRASTFYLRTVGKARGYTTKIEVTGADGQPIQINISETDKGL